MIKDLVDYPGLGNEADEAHRVAAPGTPERVDLEDPAQQLRPAAAGCVDCGWHRPGLHGRGRLGDCRYLGVVEMPLRFQPMRFVGWQIYGVQRDELDVQYVVRVRIVTRGA
ncbi:MAG: hypothetical protein HY705_10265 [Gemmatimonadetes bacterium]|nr:hypothetical protein [Gemmatimonadota bacterium]